jgi:hypothetical protein
MNTSEVNIESLRFSAEVLFFLKFAIIAQIHIRVHHYIFVHISYKFSKEHMKHMAVDSFK